MTNIIYFTFSVVRNTVIYPLNRVAVESNSNADRVTQTTGVRFSLRVKACVLCISSVTIMSQREDLVCESDIVLAVGALLFQKWS